jgi:hypothetical protein
MTWVDKTEFLLKVVDWSPPTSTSLRLLLLAVAARKHLRLSDKADCRLTFRDCALSGSAVRDRQWCDYRNVASWKFIQD